MTCFSVIDLIDYYLKILVGQTFGNVLEPFNQTNPAFEIVEISRGVKVILIRKSVNIEMKDRCLTLFVFIYKRICRGFDRTSGGSNGSESACEFCFACAEISAKRDESGQRAVIQNKLSQICTSRRCFFGSERIYLKNYFVHLFVRKINIYK